MNNIYYHSGDADEIQAILHDGFIDNLKRRDTGKRGFYIADAPGKPDPEYLNKQLLEISLPPQIDISKWILVILEKPAQWNEWVIPAKILNKDARVRRLSPEEWEQAWAKYKEVQLTQAQEELTAEGLLEHARDSAEKLMYRNGQPVWCLSEKARALFNIPKISE